MLKMFIRIAFLVVATQSIADAHREHDTTPQIEDARTNIIAPVDGEAFAFTSNRYPSVFSRQMSSGPILDQALQTMFA